MLNGAKSDSVVRSQVMGGRLNRRFQSLGRGATQAPRARLWSMDGSVRVVCVFCTIENSVESVACEKIVS